MTHPYERSLDRLRASDGQLDAGALAVQFPALGTGAFSLTDASDLALTQRLADALLHRTEFARELDAVESALTEESVRAWLGLQLAVKLARSKRLLQERPEPRFLTVVFAVYQEHERIRPPSEHPHGEDFLARKLDQLEWLLGDVPDAGYEMIVVDDGCPAGSGAIVQRVAAAHPRGDRVRVLFLEDAIRAEHPATRGLTSASESRKGGSVELGMWEAANTDRGEGHVVLFTDADLSTHLGQCGLLMDAIRGETRVAIGSRRHPRSVVLKGAARNARGKLFIYLWKRLLAPLHHVTDTQCGFKAFDARIVRPILDGVVERQFAFDIELMLRAQLLGGADDVIARVGVAWIDSEALSTTTALQPYLSMLRTAATLYRTHLPPNPEADGYAAFVEDLDEARWQALTERVPESILRRDPREFGEWSDVTVEHLRC